MRVPIELRSHERSQLDDFIPRAVENLEDIGLDEEAEEVDDVDIIDNEDGTFSAEAEEWVAIISSLRTIYDDEGVRSWWLRKKLAQRVGRKANELSDDGEEAEDDAEGGFDGSEEPSRESDTRSDEVSVEETTSQTEAAA